MCVCVCVCVCFDFTAFAEYVERWSVMKLREKSLKVLRDGGDVSVALEHVGPGSTLSFGEILNRCMYIS